MSRPVALTVSGVFTLFLLAAMGLLLLWTGRDTSSSVPSADGSVVETVQDEQAEYEARAQEAQTAIAEREDEYQARLGELERTAEERKAEYQA